MMFAQITIGWAEITAAFAVVCGPLVGTIVALWKIHIRNLEKFEALALARNEDQARYETAMLEEHKRHNAASQEAEREHFAAIVEIRQAEATAISERLALGRATQSELETISAKLTALLEERKP